MNKVIISVLFFVLIAGITSGDLNGNDDTTLNIPSEIENGPFQQYQSYINAFHKTFKSLEQLRKNFEAYQRSQEKIKRLNSMFRNDDGEEMFGETEFSDIDEQEFENTFLNFKPSDEELAKAEQGGEDNDPTLDPVATQKNSNGRNLQSSEPEIAVNWDWRAKGAVGVVKNQGSCGACWSFASVANIEGLYYNKYGELYNFAEQSLVDCSLKNMGCNGGWMEKAFAYIRNVGGLQLTKDYGSYQQAKKTCRYNAEKAIAKVKSWVFPGTNEAKIRDYLFKNGPLAAAINAKNMQNYKGGILDPSKTGCTNKVNHAVTLVGYGTSNGVDYWIVKNSWGAKWGEKGFFRIVRGQKACGINTYIVSAVLE